MSSSLEAEQIARKIIREHEGYRTHPYVDTVGKISIGIGRNLTDNGLSHGEVDLCFENDLAQAVGDAVAFSPAINQLNAVRQAALFDMAFQLGFPSLSKFVGFRAALERKDWQDSAKHILDSLYAQQVPNRAREIAEMIRSGERDDLR